MVLASWLDEHVLPLSTYQYKNCAKIKRNSSIKENPKHIHTQLFTDPLIYAGTEIYITEDFQPKRIVEKTKLLKQWNSGPQLW